MAEGDTTVETVPTSDGLIEMSQQYQLLALPMYVASSSPTDAGIAPVIEGIPAHAEYWGELQEEGVLFAGGPVLSELGSDPWSGDAIFIFIAQSLEAAHAILEADPMHASGARQYELRPWLLNHLVVPDGAKS